MEEGRSVLCPIPMKVRDIFFVNKNSDPIVDLIVAH